MFMLRRHIDAHGGSLPDDVIPVFCNTGMEREETLDFVEECSQRWGVGIRWLELRHEPGRYYFVEVNHRTASRKGEPFEMLIRARGVPGYLPNQAQRICTVEMKLKTTNRFVRQCLLWEKYFNVIGLRADERSRVARVLAKGTTKVVPTLFGDEEEVGPKALPGETPLCPLAAGGG